MRAKWAAAILALGFALPAGGYYHFMRYTNRGTPYQPMPEKFDLNALPNKTLTFFVSDSGPGQLSPNDSFASLLGQIQQAAQAWNSVDSSDLRVVFGGLYAAGTQQATPHGEIIFTDDLAPGVLASCGPEAGSDVRFGANGPFVAATRALCQFNRDLTKKPGPSYTEAFFTTAVHEMGHGLGLQHTWTSGAMSTATTRATNRVRAIDLDDVAGLSVLYPKSNFAAQFGTITGRVTSGGQGIHLASVVALRANGSAISALTNPDGTYRIDGLPQDTYWVYVHPLPPDGQDGVSPDLVLPFDTNGVPVPASGFFETLFYPGTRDPQQFTPVQAWRGITASGIDFQVQRRSSLPIYDVSTYSFFGNIGVKPAFLNSSTAVGTLVAVGTGLIAGTAATPGLGAQVLGTNLGGVNLRTYGAPQANLALDLFFMASTVGPRHLYLTVPNDAYVLPNGVNLAQKPPPSISFLNSNGDGTVTVAGSNLSGDTRIYFDSLPATMRGFSGSDQAGTAVVVPPVGFANQQATVTASNPDGQNSAFVQPVLPTYSYGPADPAGGLQISPAQLPAGVTAMVDITAYGSKFTDGQTIVGLGSGDTLVRRVWVLSPNHVVANVTVAPGAASGAVEASVISGFQVIAQPFAFQTLPANPRLPTINVPPVNTTPGQSAIYPGATVAITGSNLSVSPAGTGVWMALADQPVNIVMAAPNQIIFQVPAGIAPGPATLRLNNGADNAMPVMVQIDSPPPVITSLTGSGNATVDAVHPALAGTVLNVTLQVLDPSVLDSPGRLQLNEGGTDLTATSIVPVPGQSNTYQVQFVLSPNISGQQVQLSVSLDDSSSAPVYIPVLASRP